MQTAPSQPSQDIVSNDDLRGDGADLPPVLVRWMVRPSDDAAIVSGFLSVEIENNYDTDVTVDLGMHGFGLDQRRVLSPIGQFVVAAQDRIETQIRLEDLPVQSIGTPSQIDLVGTSSGEDWTDVRLATNSLFIQFAPNFEQAYVSTRSTWTPVVLGLAASNEDLALDYVGLRDDPMSVLVDRTHASMTGAVDTARAELLYREVVVPLVRPRGRYLDDGGEFVEVLGDVVGSGGLAMESTQVELLEALLPYGEQEEPEQPTGRGLVKVCAKYGVEYVDSGMGESILGTTGFQTYPARNATASIRAVAGLQLYWSSNLDANGCAPYLNLPNGGYLLAIKGEQVEPNNQVRFINVKDNEAQSYSWSISFSVDASTPLTKTLTTTDSLGSRAHTVAAVLYGTEDPGFTANKTYKFLLSENECGGAGAYSDPAHICLGHRDSSHSNPHMTQWKFVIGHEIGHSVERDGAGLAKRNYEHPVPTVPDSLKLCRCDHVPGSGLQSHCLQSREYAAAAWQEGFAYFYAAKIFNDPQYSSCYIGYGKHVLHPVIIRGWDPYVSYPPPVPTSCRNAVQWRKRYCYDSNDTNAGVEWDWMTFFWNIHHPNDSLASSKRVSMTDYYEIKRRACTGSPSGMCSSSHTVTYQDFQDALWAKYCGSGIACLSARYKHAKSMAILHGVD